MHIVTVLQCCQQVPSAAALLSLQVTPAYRRHGAPGQLPNTCLVENTFTIGSKSGGRTREVQGPFLGIGLVSTRDLIAAAPHKHR